MELGIGAQLARAVFAREYQTVVELLEHPDIDLDTRHGVGEFTVLISAASMGYTEICELLLEHPGTDINAQSKKGAVALSRALFRNHVPVIKLLLAHPDIDLDTRRGCNGFTELMRVASRGHAEICKLLLGHPDTNINAQSKHGVVALSCAIHGNHLPVIKLLLEHPNIDPNLGSNPCTPLILAMKLQHNAVIELVLSHGDIDPNLIDIEGKTALMEAACMNYAEMLKFLLTHKDIEVDLKDNDGNTALHHAAIKDYGYTCIPLLEKLAIVPPDLSVYSPPIAKLLKSWRTFYPRWNRLGTSMLFPADFNTVAFQWLLCCKRLKLCKDLQYLILEYIAETWKYQ